MPEPKFTFICGADDFMVSRKAKAMYEELGKDIEDDGFNKEVIIGAAGNVAEVEEAMNQFAAAVQTLSLFGDRKVVWFKDITFLADSKTGKAEGTKFQVERLKELLGTIDTASVTVLLSASPVDRRRAFVKWCEKTGDSHLVDSGKGSDQVAYLRELIGAEAEKCKLRIPVQMVHFLVEKLSGNARLAVEEVRKLATYIGDSGEPVTEELINQLVPDFGESDFFEPVEAFYSLKLEWTLDALKRYFFTNKDARPLISSLQGRNRLLIQLKVLMMSGSIQVGPRGIDKGALERAKSTHASAFAGDDTKSNFNVFSQNPWYLGRLAAPIAKISLKELVDFQKNFLGAFQGIIERPNEQLEVMRETCIRCLSR